MLFVECDVGAQCQWLEVCLYFVANNNTRSLAMGRRLPSVSSGEDITHNVSAALLVLELVSVKD